MTSVWLVVDKPATVASMMPAKPASAPPRIQLTVAIVVGDQPCAAATASFSATAVVASPNRVFR